MAWSTTRTLYKTPARDFEVILGSGGAPNVAIESTYGQAVRVDAGADGELFYLTSDSGTTWSAAGALAPATTAAGSGVSLTSERAEVRTVVLTLASTPIPLTDEAGVVAYGGLKIADLPAGSICILGSTANLALTKSSAGVNDDWDGDFALGTATASNNATLSSTEANVLPSTATPQAVAGATTATGRSTGTECPLYLDGTATAVDLYLNVLVDDADHDVSSTPCNIVATGTITLSYVNLGDY